MRTRHIVASVLLILYAAGVILNFGAMNATVNRGWNGDTRQPPNLVGMRNSGIAFTIASALLPVFWVDIYFGTNGYWDGFLFTINPKRVNS